MSRLHVEVVALALCCCFLHASSAVDTSLSPGLRVLQEVEAPASLGANGQAVIVAGEGDKAGDGSINGRMDLELEDYPGSGANDRHSPWAQRRN
ncbi:hypothetical protein QOZ80_9BG0715940 [Eleusine coracana subsp. coracana]|nr:hypothetical protein QOZ80_9BG0715940 [Eleusine coracana subsp. coracana]